MPEQTLPGMRNINARQVPSYLLWPQSLKGTSIILQVTLAQSPWLPPPLPSPHMDDCTNNILSSLASDEDLGYWLLS